MTEVRLVGMVRCVVGVWALIHLCCQRVVAVQPNRPVTLRKGCNLVQKGNSVSWGSANSYCASLGGRLCTRNEYCPNGKGFAPLQDIRSTTASLWAPVGDFTNGWVLVSNVSQTDIPCALNTELSSLVNAKAVFNPTWGGSVTDTVKDWVKCCDVKPSYILSDEALEDGNRCIIPGWAENMPMEEIVVVSPSTSAVATSGLANIVDGDSASHWHSESEPSIAVTVKMNTTSSDYIECVEKVVISWGGPYSPESFEVFTSLDGTGFFLAQSAGPQLPNSTDRVDTVAFASPVPALYVKIETNGLPRNGGLRILEFQLFGSICDSPIQKRAFALLDVGPSGQTVSDGWSALSLPTAKDITFQNMASTRLTHANDGASMGRNLTSIDVVVGCTRPGEQTASRLTGVSTQSPTTGRSNIDVYRDGLRSQGGLNVGVRGLQPGFYEVETLHHEFDASANTRIATLADGESIGAGIKSSSGYGNITLLDSRYGHQQAIFSIPSTVNHGTQHNDVHLTFESLPTAWQSNALSQVVNAQRWNDGESDGIGDHWKVAEGTWGNIQSDGCSQDEQAHDTFLGTYQRVQGKNGFRLYQENVLRANVTYILEMTYRSNASLLRAPVGSPYVISGWSPTNGAAPSFLRTTLTSLEDAALTFEGEGTYAYLDVDDIHLYPLFEEIGETDSWSTANNICTARSARLCTFEEICPFGAGRLPVFGNLRRSNPKLGANTWLPVTHGTKNNPWVLVATKYNDVCTSTEEASLTFNRGLPSDAEYDVSNNLLCCSDYSPCTNALGMNNGNIKESQLSDNGALDVTNSKRVGIDVAVGGLNGWQFNTWTPGSSYYQVDLLTSLAVSGVATQGRGANSKYVKTFQVKYSADGSSFHSVRSQEGSPTFVGNVDGDSIVKNMFLFPIAARYIRIYPMTASDSQAVLRLEFYGGAVDTCITHLGYGSVVYVRSALTERYLSAATADFNSTNAAIENAFVLVNPDDLSDQSRNAPLLFGNKFMLRSLVHKTYVSYFMGEANVVDTNLARNTNPSVVLTVSNEANGGLGDTRDFDDDKSNAINGLTAAGSAAWVTKPDIQRVSLTVDLRASYTIANVKFYWASDSETGLGPSAYYLERSDDGVGFQNVSDKNGLACTPSIDRTDNWDGWSEATRYIRMNTYGGHPRIASKGYSLYEIEIYGRLPTNEGKSAMITEADVNTTFQVIEAAQQSTSINENSKCTPTVQRQAVRARQHAAAQLLLFRRMGTSTSLGCFLAENDHDVIQRILVPSSTIALFNADSSHQNFIHMVDSSTIASVPNSPAGLSITNLPPNETNAHFTIVDCGDGEIALYNQAQSKYFSVNSAKTDVEPLAGSLATIPSTAAAKFTPKVVNSQGEIALFSKTAQKYVSAASGVSLATSPTTFEAAITSASLRWLVKIVDRPDVLTLPTGKLFSSSLGYPGLLDNKFYFEVADRPSVTLNSIRIVSNISTPAQVHGVAHTRVAPDNFTTTWSGVVNYGGPGIISYNVSRNTNVFLVLLLALHSNKDLSNAQFTLTYNVDKTECMAWNIGASDLDTKITSQLNVGQIQVSRDNSRLTKYGYEWQITFTTDDSVNSTAFEVNLADASCTAIPTSNKQRDAWVEFRVLRFQEKKEYFHIVANTTLSLRFMGAHVQGGADHDVRIAGVNDLGKGVLSRSFIHTTNAPLVPSAPKEIPQHTKIGAADITFQMNPPRSNGADVSGYVFFVRRSGAPDISNRACVHSVSREALFPVSDSTVLGTFGNTSAATFDIDNVDMSNLFNPNVNKLYKTTVLTFEVYITSTSFVPKTFVLSQSPDTLETSKVNIQLGVPQGGYIIRTWQTVQEGIPNLEYTNGWTPTATYFKDIAYLQVLRSGTVPSNDNEYIKIRNIRFCPGKFHAPLSSSFRVLGLESETTYDVKFAASNYAGIGPYSNFSTGNILTLAPTAPEKIETAPIALAQTYPDAVTLSWSLPYFGGSPIQKYFIKVTSKQNEVQLLTVRLKNGQYALRGNGATTPCIDWNELALGLQNKLNSISTQMGSKISVTTRTNTSVPNLIEFFLVFDTAPAGNVGELEVVTTGTGCSAFNSDGEVTLVEFIQGGYPSFSSFRPEEPTVTLAELTNLSGATTYNFTVAAKNGAAVDNGIAPYSDPVTVRTLMAIVPFGNTRTTMSAATVASTTLNWNLPRHGGSQIQAYAIYEKYSSSESQRIIIQSNKNIAAGNFSLIFAGKRSSCLPWNSNDALMKSALQSLTSITDITVTRPTTTSLRTVWDVSFPPSNGDVRMMVAGGYMAVQPWGDATNHDVSFSSVSIEITCGNIDSIHSISDESGSSFVVQMIEGTMKRWGKTLDGESDAIALLDNIQSIKTTERAFASLLFNHSVVSWGDADFGGSISAQINNVQTLWSTGSAFAALRFDGSVACWGNSTSGGDCTAAQSDLVSVRKIFNTRYAFAAIKTGGSVVAWGNAGAGGSLGNAASQLTSGVQTIIGNDYAFAAIKYDGEVVTWGRSTHGGDSTAVNMISPPTVSVIPSKGAFAALRADGSVTAWGSSDYGGDDSSVRTDLVKKTRVVANARAFVAIGEEGRVHAWGHGPSGGNLTSVENVLVDIVDVFAPPFLSPSKITSGVFVAKSSSGKLISWGNGLAGGDSSAVSNSIESNVSRVFCGNSACAAIKNDKTIVLWGSASKGGSASSQDIAFVNNSVSTIHIAYNTFVGVLQSSLKTDADTGESAPYSAPVDAYCSSCKAGTSGVCRDNSGICSSYITGTTQCPRTMVDCETESKLKQVTIEETLNGRSSLVQNPSFEDDFLMTGYKFGLPLGWYGSASSSYESGAVLLQSNSVLDGAGQLAHDGRNYVALVRYGAYIEQILYQLLVNEKVTVKISFASKAGEGTSQFVEVYFDDVLVFGPYSPSSKFISYDISFSPRNSSGVLRIRNASPKSHGKKIIFIDHIVSDQFQPRVGRATSTARSIAMNRFYGDANYSFAVKGINVVGEGSFGMVVSDMTDSATVPDKVTGIRVSNIHPDYVYVCWDAAAPNGARIYGYRVKVNNAIHMASTNSIDTCSYVYELNGNTAYTFKVAALNRVGAGTDSDASSSITTLDATAPSSAENAPVIDAVGFNTVQLSWTRLLRNGGNKITDYKIEYESTVLHTVILRLKGTSISSKKFAITVDGQSSGCLSVATAAIDLEKELATLMGNWKFCSHEYHTCVHNGSHPIQVRYLSSTNPVGYVIHDGPVVGDIICEQSNFPYNPEPSGTNMVCEYMELPVRVHQVESSTAEQAWKIVFVSHNGDINSPVVEINKGSNCPSQVTESEIAWTPLYNVTAGIRYNVTKDETLNVLSYTVNNLFGSRLYRFRTYVTNAQGTSGPSPWSKWVLTENPKVPSRPGVPQITKTSPHYWTLKWTKPIDGGDAITGYKVYWKRRSSEVIYVRVPSNTISFKLSFSAVGDTSCLQASASADTVGSAISSTSLKNPGYTLNYKVRNLEENSWYFGFISDEGNVPDVTVCASTTSDCSSCDVSGAVVIEKVRGKKFTDEREIYIENTNLAIPEANVTNLYYSASQPGKYQFQVAAINKVGESPPSLLSSATEYTMADGDAPAPIDVNAYSENVQPQEMTLVYTEPVAGGSIITNYTLQSKRSEVVGDPWVDVVVGNGRTITYTQEGLTDVGHNRPLVRLTINNFAKGTYYIFRLKASNLRHGISSGFGLESNILRTAFSLPAKPPGVPVYLGFGPTWVNISYEEPDDIGGTPMTGYIASQNTEGGTNYYNYRSFSCPGSKLWCVINGLTPSSSYAWRMSAVNVMGEGPRGSSSGRRVSKVSFNLTVSGVAYEAAHLTKIRDAFNNKYTKESWYLATWTATYVSGTNPYMVHIRAYGLQILTPIIKIKPDIINGGISFVSILSDETLTGVTSTDVPASSINIEVCGQTAKANGEKQPFWEDAPCGKTTASLSVPEKVSTPKIEASHEFAVTISWDVPENGGSPITSYTIESQQRRENGNYDNADFRAVVITQSAYSGVYTVENLEKGRSFRFRVKAQSSVGFGPYSSISNEVMTVATIPRKPGNVTIVKIRPTYVTLNWTAPVDEGGFLISGYQINKTVGASNKFSIHVVSTNSRDTLAIAEGLTPSTSYVFRVAAVNDLGVGILSNPSPTVVTLAPQFPGPTGKPTVMELNTTYGSDASVSIKWTPPRFNGGSPITDYSVFLRESIQEVQIVKIMPASPLPLGQKGGQLKLTYGGFHTGCLDWSSNATEIELALKSLSSVEDVRVMRSLDDSSRTSWTITFVTPGDNRPSLGYIKGSNTGVKCASGDHGPADKGQNCYFPFKFDGFTYDNGVCRRAGPGGPYNERGWCPTSPPPQTSSDYYFLTGYKWGSCIDCPPEQCTAFNASLGEVNISVSEAQPGSNGDWTTARMGLGLQNSTALNVSLHNIEPGRMVNVKIKAANSISAAGEDEFYSDPILVRSDMPSNVDPTTYSILQVTTDYITLQWDKPSLKGSPFLRGYKIYGRNWSEGETIPPDSEFNEMVSDTGFLYGVTPSYTITGLPRARNFQLCVVPMNDLTFSMVLSLPKCGANGTHSNTVKVLSKVPDQINDFSVLGETDEGTLKLSFTVPKAGGVPTTKYSVFVNGESNELQSISIRNTSYMSPSDKIKLEYKGSNTDCFRWDANENTVEAKIRAMTTVNDVDVLIPHLPGGMLSVIAREISIEFVGNDANTNMDPFTASFCTPEPTGKSVIVTTRRDGQPKSGGYVILTNISASVSDEGTLTKYINHPKGSRSQFAVSGYNEVGYAPRSESSPPIPVKYNTSLPGKPVIIEKVERASSFSFKCLVNDKGGYYVVGFVTTVMNSNNETIGQYASSNTEQTVTQSGLTFGTVYNVEVVVVGVTGTNSIFFTISTGRKVPGDIVDIPTVFDVTYTSLVLNWTAPQENGGSPILAYQIESKQFHRKKAYISEVQSLSANGTTENTNVKFVYQTNSGVTESTYCVELSSASAEKVKFALQSLPAIGTVEVMRSTFPVNNASYFHSTWTVTFSGNRGNVNLVSFDRAACSHAPKTSMAITTTALELVKGKDENPWLTHVNRTNNASTQVLINNLEYGTVYLFRVAAFNSIGRAVAFSLPSEPKESKSSFSLFLSGMKATMFTTGNQTAYRQVVANVAGVKLMQVVITSFDEAIQDVASSEGGSGRRLLTAYRRRLILTDGLNVDTIVQNLTSTQATKVGESIQTAVGDSSATGFITQLQSSSVQVTQMEIVQVPTVTVAPPVQSLSTVPTKPAAPSAPNRITAKSIDLEWIAPFDGGSEIIAYDIHQNGILIKKIQKLGIATTATIARIENLRSGKSYKFSVTAINSHGASESSDNVTITTAQDLAPPTVKADGVSVANGTTVYLYTIAEVVLTAAQGNIYYKLRENEEYIPYENALNMSSPGIQRLFAITKNAFGEFGTVFIADIGLSAPRVQAAYVTIVGGDTDANTGSFSGSGKIKMPSSLASQLEMFHVYWGNHDLKKSSETLVLSVPKCANECDWAIANIATPKNTSCLIFLAANSVGENMDSPKFVIVFDEGTGAPTDAAIGVEFIDYDASEFSIEGVVNIYHPKSSLTIKMYTLYWQKNGTQEELGTVQMPNTGGNSASFNITKRNLPKDVTHIAVRTKRSASEEHATVTYGRLLDLVGKHVRVPYGRTLSYMERWLGHLNNAVICRVAIAITRTAVAYTKKDIEIDAYGNRIHDTAIVRSGGISYPYFATQKKLMCLSTAGFTGSFQFNKKMNIDCVVYTNEPLASSNCLES